MKIVTTQLSIALGSAGPKDRTTIKTKTITANTGISRARINFRISLNEFGFMVKEFMCRLLRSGLIRNPNLRVIMVFS